MPLSWPRIAGVSSTWKALSNIWMRNQTSSMWMQDVLKKRFDMVLTMPRLDDMDPYLFGKEIKQKYQNLPVFLLTHGGHADVERAKRKRTAGKKASSTSGMHFHQKFKRD